MVILHGAGSAKESHFDFARGCRDDGMAALAYDARGHGRSEGASGRAPSTTRWRWSSCSARTRRAVALRGSSMGGFGDPRRAPARRRACAAVVAICPAPEDSLLRLRSGRAEFELRRGGHEPWLESLDTVRRRGGPGPRDRALLLHARGDEQVPYTVSEELYEAAREPKRLLLLPGGHHRSLQHDLELQAVSRRFIRAAAGRAGARARLTENHSR